MREPLLEEQFKVTLSSVVRDFGERGLTIGTQYYILKDVFNEVSMIYQKYIQQKLQEQNEDKKEEEE